MAPTSDQEIEAIQRALEEKGGTNRVVQGFGLDTSDFDSFGAEHHVQIDPVSGRVDKYTGIASNYDIDEGIDPLLRGATMVLDPVTGRPLPGEYRDNTPIGYLSRMAWQNYLLGDDVRLERFDAQKGTFHISQPVYVVQSDDDLSDAETEAYLDENGWVAVIPSEDGGTRSTIFLHQESRVMATDFKPANFGRRKDGSLIAFDPVLLPTKQLFPDT